MKKILPMKSLFSNHSLDASDKKTLLKEVFELNKF